jgi:undecaprenyl-diphosphatase
VKRSVSVLLLLLLVFAKFEARSQGIDYKWLKTINYNRDDEFDGFMNGASNSMYTVSAALPITQLVIGYATRNPTTIRNGWTTVGALAVSFAATSAMKYSFHRDRPFMNHPDLLTAQTNNSPSFPSGHTSTAFACAAALSFEYPKWYVIAPSFAWAGAVGYSRMYLGRHYPSDVLIGAVIGTGSAYLSYKFNRWIDGKHKRSSSSLTPVPLF